MKKLFIFMLLLSFIGVTFSQTTVNYSLSPNKSDYTYVGKTTDAMGTGDSLISVAIYKETDSKMNCHAFITLDKTSGADSVLISLQAKGTDGGTFSTITTKKWYGTVDTSFYIQTTSSGQYKFWNIKILGYHDNLVAKLTDIEFLFLKD